MKIQIMKKQAINNGILFEFYCAKNLENNQESQSKTIGEYYGDDIINFCLMKNINVETGKGITYIGRRAYAPAETVETTIYEYSDNEDIREEEIEKQGWHISIEAAIRYVAFN